MLLAAVDIGNTRTTVGLFRGRRLLRSFSLPTPRLAEANRRLKKADAVAVASVVPRAERRLRHPGLRMMGKDFDPAVAVGVDRPEEVGMDRLANASGAHARAGGACVAVDVGTAITFDVVNGRGVFVGGLIAPGMELGAKSLAEHTAQLPAVSPARPRRLIGRRTEGCIRSGLYWSAAGLIEVGLRRLRREMGTRLRVYGTGGQAGLFRPLFDRVIPALTLEGIRISYVRHGHPDDGARPRSHRRH